MCCGIGKERVEDSDILRLNRRELRHFQGQSVSEGKENRKGTHRRLALEWVWDAFLMIAHLLM